MLNFRFKGGSNTVNNKTSKVNDIIEVMKEGEVSSDGRRIITQLDGKTKAIFGLDLGDNAHPLKLQGYPKSGNHMNIEIQVTSSGGNVRTPWDMHLILDDSKKVINKVLTGAWTKRR